MNHLEAHINALRGFALLQTCSDSYLKRIAAKCFTNKFRTYTVIIPQGQRPDGVYFIKSGKVKVSLDSSHFLCSLQRSSEKSNF